MGPRRLSRRTRWLLALAVAVPVLAGLASWPSAPAYAQGSPPTTAAAPAPPPDTLAPIQGRIPPPPSTVPFVTRAQSGHVDPRLAKISLAAFALALLIMGTQFFLTRPGRSGRRTL